MPLIVREKRLLVSIIAILLLTTIFAGIVNVSVGAQTGTVPLAETSSVTSDKVQASQKKHVIFRDDDIGHYVNLDTLKAVNQVHIDENVPVTLGIIPHHDTSVDGNELLMDEPLRDYLRSIATDPLFEFAQHGYKHSDNGENASLVGGVYYPRSSVGAGESSVYWHPSADRLVSAQLVGFSEFEGRPYEDQYNAIKKGWDDMEEALGVTPTTFIPPWNSGDANTLKAAHAVGHTLYSGQDDLGGVSVPGIELQAGDFEIPWDNTTNWDTYMPTLISQTDAALNAAGNGEDIVIYYHYWAFEEGDGAIDSNKIMWLENYIEHMKDRGDVDFTTLDNQHGLSESARTHITLTASNMNPVIGQSVTFTGTLSQWNPAQNKWVALANKPVQIWHVTPYPSRTDDATVTTNTNGNFTWTANGGWNSAGLRPHSATFYGDTDYIQSLSVPVNISVGALSSWESLDGYLTASPAAVSSADGRIDVFGQGSDHALWHRSYANNAWSTWESLGGQLAATTGPAVSAQSAGKLDVFVIGRGDHALWHRSYANNAWSTWESLGGYLTASPAAVSSADGHIDVFGQGSDHALWHRSYANNAWSTWESLSGQLADTTGPAVSSQAAGQLDVFVTGLGDHALWHRSFI